MRTYLKKYSKDWPQKFKNESKKIRLLLDNKIINIQHIGSTSIPGMFAKPIIDMGVFVDSIDNISLFTKKLKSLGYKYEAKMSSVERIFLRKGDPVEYHLSIACSKHSFWERQIVFRDYLKKHKELINEYNNLKLNNIKIVPKKDFNDLSKSKIYNQGKGDFVAKVLKLAEDTNFMKEALKEAKIALKEGNWPIGCVIVLNNKIISRAHNLVYSKKDKLAHAEMIALQQAKDILHKNKNKAVMYTTYEPCPMCFGASVLNRIKKVVCGIDLDNSGAMYFRNNLPLLFKQNKFSLEFETGVLAKECHKVFIQGEPTKKLIKANLILKNNKKC